MNFFKRLANLFSGPPATNSNLLTIYLLSRRCREPIMGQVNLLNELSLADESEHSHYARKVFRTSGRNRCFDQIEVQLWFNQNKQVVEHEVTGGTWLSADEYERELTRFNAPPVEDPKSEENN